MEFQVFRSPKDDAFDPVAQYLWNVEHGFGSSEYSILLKKTDANRLNELEDEVQARMMELSKAILDLIQDSDSNWDNFVQACEAGGDALAATPIFGELSSDTIVGVIDSLIKLEEFGEVNDYQEDIWSCLDKVITSPGCPRPVLWRIVDEIKHGRGFNLIGPVSQQSSGVYYSLCKNPVLGDTLLEGHEVSDGNLDAIFNPSLTFRTLERLYPSFAYYYFTYEPKGDSGTADSLIGKLYRNIPSSLISLPRNLRGNPELTAPFDGTIMFSEYVIFAARLDMEIKLGRATVNDFLNSDEFYVSYLGNVINGSLDLFTKDRPQSTQIVKINQRALSLLQEMVAK